MHLAKLIDFYHGLTLERVGRFSDFYTPDAFFKDPFNEVHGVEAIQQIFRHMFRQVAEPRFLVTEQFVGEQSAMLLWEFHFRIRLLGKREHQVMRGVSHLRFANDGRVSYHRDYWDSSEELYMKLPAIGTVMRGLRRIMSA